MARLNLNDNDLTNVLVGLRATGQHALAERIQTEARNDDDDNDESESARDCRLDGEDDLINGVGFADSGGNSALRAATRSNPRVHPCPTCGRANALTPADVRQGYQCNRCADAAERGGS